MILEINGFCCLVDDDDLLDVLKMIFKQVRKKENDLRLSALSHSLIK